MRSNGRGERWFARNERGFARTDIVIPIIFRSATVSVATREQDAPTLNLMVFIWNDYIISDGMLQNI